MFTFVIFISGSAPDFTHQEANFFCETFHSICAFI